MRASSRLFLFLLLLTLALCLSTHLMLASKPVDILKDATSVYQAPDDQEILKTIYSSPLRFIFLQIFTLVFICGLFLGLALDITFLSNAIKNKGSRFAKDFIHADLVFDEFLKVLLLIVFFFFSIKFMQLMLVEAFSFHKFTLALVLNGFLEIFSILSIVIILGRRRFTQSLPSAQIVMATLKQYAGLLPIFMLVLFTTLFTFRYFDFKPAPMPAVALFIKEKSIFNMVMLFVEGVILAPIFEELFFRGVIYGFLRKKRSVGFSAIVSGIFFSLLHGNAFAFFPILILGIALACLYERTKTITAPILMHSLHNLCVLILLFIVKPY